ncbi:MAG: hypothetical protein R2710_23430 [Acidimicrobiales bacterium]
MTTAPAPFDNRITRLLGVDYPIIQAFDGVDRPQPTGVGGVERRRLSGSSRPVG